MRVGVIIEFGTVMDLGEIVFEKPASEVLITQNTRIIFRKRKKK